MLELQSIENEFNIFKDKFIDCLREEEEPVREILHYLSLHFGNCIRPKIVLLVAGMNGGINEETYKMSVLVELLHLSSLVHDDVIDDSSIRRGVSTVNCLWNNKIAVLSGDYLLSKVLNIILGSKIEGVTKKVSETVRDLTNGEIQQLHAIGNFNLSEDEYIKIVDKKTASLMSLSFSLGAMSSGKTEGEVEKFSVLGRKFGLAFQMKDDLKDCFLIDSGKEWAKDIKEHQITMPLIYAISSMEESEKNIFYDSYINHGNDSDKIKSLIEEIKNKGGIRKVCNALEAVKFELLKILEGENDSLYVEDLKIMINKICKTEMFLGA